MTAAELLAAIEVEHLTLPPGAILVFKCPQQLTSTEFETIREHIQRVLPDTRVLVVEGGADVAVLEADT